MKNLPLRAAAYLPTALLIVAFIKPHCSLAIINGTEVADTDSLANHVIALQMEEKQADGTMKFYKGTGVLVLENVILTAGHNFHYLPRSDSGAAIFNVKPNWGPDPSGQIRIRVKQVEIHPGFQQTASGTEDDLALVLLQSPSPHGDHPLPIAGPESQIPMPGSLGTVAGYGKSVEVGEPAPLSDFVLRETVNLLLNMTKDSPFNSPKIWLDQSTKGFCSGDSGAPALFQDLGGISIYGIAIHTGFNPAGKMTCLTTGAFTNVIFYREWIKQALQRLTVTE